MMAVFQGFSMLLYTPDTYPGQGNPGQGAAQEARPGLVEYAHVRSTGMPRGRGRVLDGDSGGKS